MKLRINDDGEYVIDESGCSASYAWWGPPPYSPSSFTDLETGETVQVEDEYGDDDPGWVTSFCVLDAGHEEPHRDIEGNEFEAGEERGRVG